MEEKTPQDLLKFELERKHYARAALLAASLGLPEEEIRDFRLKALWQMSAVSRNASGTISLAQQYGLAKAEAEGLLRERAAEEKKLGEYKALEPCYDHGSGKYLSFEEWLDQLLRKWETLSVS